MRGLPFSACAKEVAEFLDGINLVNNENGILLIKKGAKLKIATQIRK